MKTWAYLGTFVLLTVAAADARAQKPAAGARSPATAANAGNEDAVKQRLAGYAQAFNARNVAGIVDFFVDDAALVDLDGNVTRGKATINEQFARGFAEPSKYTLKTTAETVRFIAPDVAQVEGTSKLEADGEASIVTRFITLVVKKGDAWRIAEIRDLPGPAEDVEPYERLKELEWMVGDWVDESANATINSSIRWSDNRAFLIRDAHVQIGKEKSSHSMTIIGWDPRTAQIKSWLFDSAGGLGEAVWTRSSDNQWVIKASGVLRDGSATSATQIVTLVSKDRVSTSSLDRIIGGEIAPDIEEIVTVRKAPGAASKAP